MVCKREVHRTVSLSVEWHNLRFSLPTDERQMFFRCRDGNLRRANGWWRPMHVQAREMRWKSRGLVSTISRSIITGVLSQTVENASSVNRTKTAESLENGLSVNRTKTVENGPSRPLTELKLYKMAGLSVNRTTDCRKWPVPPLTELKLQKMAGPSFNRTKTVENSLSVNRSKTVEPVDNGLSVNRSKNVENGPSADRVNKNFRCNRIRTYHELRRVLPSCVLSRKNKICCFKIGTS